MSDGCTFAPDTINGISLKPPCKKHDDAYDAGGSWEDRLAADTQLRTDIEAKGMPVVAAIYYHAVRLFGGRRWPHKYHWGRNWPKSEYGYGYGEPAVGQEIED